MTKDEALWQALDALEIYGAQAPAVRQTIIAIKEALAQPDYRAVKTYHEGKPVYVSQTEQELEYCADYRCAGDCGQPHNQQEMQAFLATQPKRPWIGLTDEDISSVLRNLQVMYNRPPTTDSRAVFARAIEATLKEKNT